MLPQSKIVAKMMAQVISLKHKNVDFMKLIGKHKNRCIEDGLQSAQAEIIVR